MFSAEIFELIVFVMVVTIVATVTLAVISYGAFRAREKRQASPGPTREGNDRPHFFEKVHLPASPGTTK